MAFAEVGAERERGGEPGVVRGRHHPPATTAPFRPPHRVPSGEQPDDRQNQVAAVALREDRVRVTENVKDFAGERDLAVVCVLKAQLPAQGMGGRLAQLLDRWAGANPDPYVGLHWPKIDG